MRNGDKKGKKDYNWEHLKMDRHGVELDSRLWCVCWKNLTKKKVRVSVNCDGVILGYLDTSQTLKVILEVKRAAQYSAALQMFIKMIYFFLQALTLWDRNTSYIATSRSLSENRPSETNPWQRTVTWQQCDRWWRRGSGWGWLCELEWHTHKHTHAYINRYSLKTGGTITSGSYKV